jgi:hypothetical protein
MARIKTPLQDVTPIENIPGRWTPDWYDFFRQLDGLDPLSSIVFPHDVTKSDITRTLNAQSGTTYTFALADAGSLCEFTNGSAVTVTIPTNASVAFPVGTQIDVTQGGAGKVTFAGAGGVTLKSVGSNKSLSAQEAGGTLVQMSANVWRLVGSLIP